jgi:hypothetical protein
MAKPTTARRRIDPAAGSQQFVVSEINPNHAVGEQCACGHRPTDQQGPFVVFAGDAMPHHGRRVRTVVCAGCAKAAVLSIERGDEVSVVGTGSLTDAQFDGGQPDVPEDLGGLKLEYQGYAARVGLLNALSWNDWLDEKGYDGNRPDPVITGVDPNAKSLLQARADTSPVGMKGGAVHGRIDDPVEQLGNPDNWGVPEGFEQGSE